MAASSRILTVSSSACSLVNVPFSFLKLMISKLSLMPSKTTFPSTCDVDKATLLMTCSTMFRAVHASDSVARASELSTKVK